MCFVFFSICVLYTFVWWERNFFSVSTLSIKYILYRILRNLKIMMHMRKQREVNIRHKSHDIKIFCSSFHNVHENESLNLKKKQKQKQKIVMKSGICRMLINRKKNSILAVLFTWNAMGICRMPIVISALAFEKKMCIYFFSVCVVFGKGFGMELISQ